jgi:hypothetical protein
MDEVYQKFAVWKNKTEENNVLSREIKCIDDDTELNCIKFCMF